MLWGLQGRAYADGDVLDATWGTIQTAVDTGGATSAVYISPATAAITIAGAPAAGQLVQLRIKRDPTDASDTLAVTADLLGVMLTFTRA